jgi:A/G-specific adenine glycosylase
LIAEMMLQRTRSGQVVPVYERFVERYPNLAALSGAEPRALSEIMRPLGLAFRVRTFRELSRVLMNKHDGEVPIRAEDAIQLPGVGPYVASALDAFLRKRRIPIIDANIARVLGRVFGVGGAEWRHATAEERRAMHEIAWLSIGRVTPRGYHYALLDFAAMVCTPRNPACPDCPMHRARICAYCEASFGPAGGR